MANKKKDSEEEVLIVRTRTSCADGDWKTQSAKGYSNIPAGAEVRPIRVWTNFYGIWVSVFWNGHKYDVRPDDVRIYKVRRVTHAQPHPGDVTWHNRYEDAIVIGGIDLAPDAAAQMPNGCIIIKSKKYGLQLADPDDCSYFRSDGESQFVASGRDIRRYADELNIEDNVR